MTGRGSSLERILAAVRTLMAMDLVGGLLGLTVRSLLAKTITTAEFGLYGVVYALVMFIGNAAAPDIAYTTFIATARAAQRDDEASSWGRFSIVSSLAIGLSLAAAFAILAPWLASLWLGTPQAVLPLLLVAPGLALAPLWYSSMGALAGYDRFSSSAGSQIALQSTLLVLAGVAVIGLGSPTLVFAAVSLALAAAATYAAGSLWRAAAPKGRRPAGWSIAELGDRSRRIARYYAPLLGKSMGSQLVDKFGLFVIAGTLPLAVAGAYAAVMPLAAFSIVFARWTYGPLATHFAERYGVDDDAGAARLLWGSTSLFAVTSCLIALGIALMGPMLIALIFSTQYLVAADAFAVLLFATALGGVGGPAVRALLASHKTAAVATISLSTGVLSVGLAYVAARRFGMLGVASTTAAALTIQATAYVASATVGERGRARYFWLGAPFAVAGSLYVAARALIPEPSAVQQVAAAVLGVTIYVVTMTRLTPMLSLAEITRLARASFPTLFARGER